MNVSNETVCEEACFFKLKLAIKNSNIIIVSVNVLDYNTHYKNLPIEQDLTETMRLTFDATPLDRCTPR